jgi:hypothetical protein
MTEVRARASGHVACRVLSTSLHPVSVPVAQPVLTAHHLFLGLVGLLRRLGTPEPETALSCSRAYGEWPPTFVVYPAEDVRDELCAVLATVLERPVSNDTPRWRFDAGEARRIAEFSGESAM